MADAPPPLTGSRPQTILLVDDEVDILDSLKELIEGTVKGVRVLTAENGQAALAILKKESTDLIVSDFKMPGMNGLDFLVEARKVAPGVPRILITAFPDLDLAIRAVNEASIENFFTKPLEPDKILDILQRVLKERKAEEQRKQSFARSLDVLRRKAKEE